MICINSYDVSGTPGKAPPEPDFKKVEVLLVLDGLSVFKYQNMTVVAKTALTTSITNAAASRLGVDPSQITVTYTTGHTLNGRRLAVAAPVAAPALQVVITITVPAAKADAVVAAVATELPSAAATAAIFLPAIVSGLAAVPAAQGGTFAVALAATFAITTEIVTAAPVAYTADSYNKKEVRRLNKKCKNKKSWCDSVTLSSGKGKCQSYCKDGKCTAARKVKKSCKARCKKRCRAFVLSPYHVSGR
tara:strand:- start:194 stop:934 length:741 start_codon:yes stop_codon:yes gene_type:complete